MSQILLLTVAGPRRTHTGFPCFGASTDSTPNHGGHPGKPWLLRRGRDGKGRVKPPQEHAMVNEIASKVRSGQRISSQEAGILFEQAEDGLLIELAQSVRARFHKPGHATWLIMAIVNYTNVCVARCDYCAFYRMPGQEGTYHLSFDQVCDRIDAVVGLGGTMIGFNGGFHPDLGIDHYTDLFSRVRARYPGLTFYEMTVAEFMFVCKRNHIPYAEGAAQFAACGTRWITGGGSEILTDSFRLRHSPGKYKTEDYYAAQKAILDAGMGSTGTMVIGFDESLAERLAHLERLRRFQDEEGRRLSSFLCWTYKPYSTDLGGKEVGLQEYLRWLAICRIYLDNIVHLRTSVLTRNEGALQGLLYGANDFDLPTEDEVTRKAGATITHDFEQILESGRKLGFTLENREPLRPWSGSA